MTGRRLTCAQMERICLKVALRESIEAMQSAHRARKRPMSVRGERRLRTAANRALGVYQRIFGETP